MKTNSIYFNTNSAINKILLEDLRFLLNLETSNTFGGNVFIQDSGHFAQNKICCTNCSSNSQGKHSYVRIHISTNSKVYTEQCSFVQLHDSNGMGTFHNVNGACNFNNINISNTENNIYSCFNVEISIDSTISSSNYKNNSATKGIAIRSSNGFNYVQHMSYCNVIEQMCYENYEGLIRVLGFLKIDSCIIKDNYAFGSYLFYVLNGKGIVITNSYINNPLIESFANKPESVSMTRQITNEKEIIIDFKIIKSCKGRKYLQINLAEYETIVNNKGVSISFYLTSAYLTTLHAPA